MNSSNLHILHFVLEGFKAWRVPGDIFLKIITTNQYWLEFIYLFFYMQPKMGALKT